MNSIEASTLFLHYHFIPGPHNLLSRDDVLSFLLVSQGMCRPEGFPGSIMLFKERCKSVSSQGPALEFGSFLFLPLLVQLLLCCRTGHIAYIPPKALRPQEYRCHAGLCHAGAVHLSRSKRRLPCSDIQGMRFRGHPTQRDLGW